jgi:hypothetical protein
MGALDGQRVVDGGEEKEGLELARAAAGGEGQELGVVGDSQREALVERRAPPEVHAGEAPEPPGERVQIPPRGHVPEPIGRAALTSRGDVECSPALMMLIRFIYDPPAGAVGATEEEE